MENKLSVEEIQKYFTEEGPKYIIFQFLYKNL